MKKTAGRVSAMCAGVWIYMAISGHKTRSAFDRYNIVSDRDLTDAAAKMERHVEAMRKNRPQFQTPKHLPPRGTPASR